MGEEIRIQCNDGVQLAGTLTTPTTPRATVVMAAAMGVPRGFYGPLARYLASRDIAVLTFDYRGVGDSRLDASRTAATRLEDWGRYDIDAALRTAGQQVRAPLFLAGHSCGGQLMGLAPESARLRGAILVSAQLADWRLWPMPARIGVFAPWHLVIPVLSAGRSVFPARRLGISSVDVPSGVTAQWARWARHRGYLFSPGLGIDVHRYAQFDFPLLAYQVDDDNYAPATAVDALLRRLPATKQHLVKLHQSDVGVGAIGHFGFFREKMRDRFWPALADWVLQNAP